MTSAIILDQRPTHGPITAISGLLRRPSSIGAIVLSLVIASPAAAQPVRIDARPAVPQSSHVVSVWNRIATDAFAPSQGTNPMAQSRTLAILQASVHDALNAIEPRFQSYSASVSAAPGASIDAAVATAARDVLTALLPEASALVEPAYARALDAVTDGPAKNAGIAVGQAAASANLARRFGDGAAQAGEPAYVPVSGPGEYQFTPPFEFAAMPHWGRVTPFVIELAEHAVEGPLALTSMAYARDVAAVQAIGEKHSRVRTRDQSDMAAFWYEDSPIAWNRIANAVIAQRGLDAWTAARLLALVNFAMADGFIAGFDAKYRFRFWRPETAIRAADTDGHPLTMPVATWHPFQITPPVPDYPSTHTVLGWAAAEVLITLVGDKVAFRADSLTMPGVTREYRRISDAARENGLSRLYAGIHFPHAIHDGRRQGRSIGRAVAKALAPVS